jgi:hypothetical protein
LEVWCYRVIFRVTFPEAREVTVQNYTTTQNELGEKVPTWTDAGTLKMEIWPLTAEQRRDLAGVIPTATHKGFTTGQISGNRRIVDGAITYLSHMSQDWGSHREVVLEWLALT